MQYKNIDRCNDVINSYCTVILSNSGYKEHAKFSKEYGHHKNQSEEELFAIENILNNLKNNDIDLYKKIYNKLFQNILQDNINGNLNDESFLNGTPYSIFNRVREFTDFVREIEYHNYNNEFISTYLSK